MKIRFSCLLIILVSIFYFSGFSQVVYYNPQKMYKKALGDYSDNDYRASIRILIELLERYPAYEHKDNVYYWLGKSFFNIKEYKKALHCFYALLSRFPDSNKTDKSRDAVSELQEILRTNPETIEKSTKRNDAHNDSNGSFSEKDSLTVDSTIHSQPTVSNVFYETDLIQALQDLSIQAGIPIIADNTVHGFVTIEINDLPFETALRRILMVGGYSFKKVDSFYLVGLADPSNPAFSVLSTTANIKVNYLAATKAVELLSDYYKPYIKANDSNNSISVTASSEIITQIKADLKIIDSPPKQVEIEAMIMEVKKGSLKSFGIDWYVFGSDSGNTYSGGANLSPGLIDTLGPIFGFDHLGKDFLEIGKIPFDIVARLRALVQDGKAEIRANPKIVTANAQPANIFITKDQYFSVVTGPLNYPYTKLEKVSVGIFLTIKPFISESDEITVNIETEVSGAVGQGREGLPLVDTRKVNTQIRVNDGQFITIGGLTQYNIRKEQNKVPLFGSIPIIGYLFSHTKYEKIKTDVVILIRPHIL